MKIENVSQTISSWLKNKLIYTSIGHNYAIFTCKGEYGWEDYINMTGLKNMVEYNESIIIYDKEANSFTKYDK